MKEVQEVGKLVDKLGHPSRMSKEQWVEFLEEVIGECQAKHAAALEEMGEKEDGV